MQDRSLPQGERGYELLLEHYSSLTHVAAPRTPAFRRLEEAVGGDLARLLVVALAKQQRERLVA